MTAVELAIIGAGPAGMAAAVLADELGLDTVLIDEQGAPGGQIYRAIERAAPDTPLGADYLAGRPLAAALRASRVDYWPNTVLWHADPEGALFLATAGRTASLTARRIGTPARLTAAIDANPLSSIRRAAHKPATGRAAAR